MLIPRPDGELFFRLYGTLMHWVNDRLRIVPDDFTPETFPRIAPESRVAIRKAFLGRPDLLDTFVNENPCHLTAEELDIVNSWRHGVSGRFFVYRYMSRYTVFLNDKDPPTAYAVLGLSQTIESLVGPHLPVMVETLLLPFRDMIIYDGVVHTFNITFGGGIRRSLNESYKLAKESTGIITSLPATAGQRTASPASRPKKKAPRTRRSDEVRDILTVVIGLIDQFCKVHLNDEYAALCRELAEKLARKRPSPLLRGRPEGWACGIIRTIGWVNFLDDRSQSPHMKLTDIDHALGVGESTGAAKSSEIRRLVNIKTFDPNWTLPSKLGDNPLAWMIEVNGFAVDVRHAPRNVQEIAFQKGLIPYIPADRE